MFGKATLFLVGCLALVVPAMTADSPALDVEVNLEPSTDHEGAYRCVAVVRDAGSGEALSAPTITFPRGEEARVTSEVPGGRFVRLTVLVSEDGSRASYRVELVVGESVVTAQSATITL